MTEVTQREGDISELVELKDNIFELNMCTYTKSEQLLI